MSALPEIFEKRVPLPGGGHADVLVAKPKPAPKPKPKTP